MNKEKIVSILKEENILQEIDNGPTSFVLSEGKKDILLQVKRVDDYIEATTGKILKHKVRIPISDIEG